MRTTEQTHTNVLVDSKRKAFLWGVTSGVVLCALVGLLLFCSGDLYPPDDGRVQRTTDGRHLVVWSGTNSWYCDLGKGLCTPFTDPMALPARVLTVMTNEAVAPDDGRKTASVNRSLHYPNLEFTSAIQKEDGSYQFMILEPDKKRVYFRKLGDEVQGLKLIQYFPDNRELILIDTNSNTKFWFR